jgi:DNA repair protein RecN (Recombination protein N)
VLVELHGQQDDRGLLDPRNHRAMLDDFGGLAPLRAAVAAAWAERTCARKALELGGGAAGGDAPRGGVPAPCRRRDRRARARQGEEAELDARRRLMQAAEKMRADVARAAPPCRPRAPRGAGRCAPLARRLTDRPMAGSTGALAALERAMVELGEAQSEVAGFADRLVFNPAELGGDEERLFALRGLARKHGVVADDLERLRRGDRGAGRGARRRGGGDRDLARPTRTPWPSLARRR